MEQIHQPQASVNLFTTYMPIITLLIGTFLGFFFSLWKDKINEDRKYKKEKKELSLKRLEEIFINISEINTSALKTYYDLIANKENNESVYSVKVSFLIRSFFPHLKQEYTNYLEIYREFKEIQINMYVLYSKDQKSTPEEALLLEEKTKYFVKKSSEFLSLIINETEKYQ